MASIVSVQCCTCRCPLNDIKSQKKRKRLHTEACREICEVMNSLISDRSLSLNCFRETLNRDAFICWGYYNEVKSIVKLQEQVKKLQEKVCQKLLALDLLRVIEDHQPPTAANDIFYDYGSRSQLSTISDNQSGSTSEYQSMECEQSSMSTTETNQVDTSLSVNTDQAQNTCNHDQLQSNDTKSPDLFVDYLHNYILSFILTRFLCMF